jgi:hypothetical protein
VIGTSDTRTSPCEIAIPNRNVTFVSCPSHIHRIHFDCSILLSIGIVKLCCVTHHFAYHIKEHNKSVMVQHKFSIEYIYCKSSYVE